MKQYFISGTDTGCGKTFVTGLLLDHFHRHGQKAQALKPVASGVEFGQNEDIVHLQAHNHDADMPINRWLFSAPIAPHIAAKQEGVHLCAQQIADFCHERSRDCQTKSIQHLLIEGAGGLMVPLNEKETWIDFLKITEIPIILVVGVRLGCINHALLTEAVIRSQHLACQGWIANCLDKEMLALSDNLATLENKLTIPLLGTVRHGELQLADVGPRPNVINHCLESG